MRKVLIFVIDGCAPEYLTEKTAPDIFRLAKQDGGFVKTVQAAVPTVTNVNHACILSGAFPEDTHVIGNYYYNRQTGEQGFIESHGFMKAPTILQRYQAAGGKTALLTVKGKVLEVFGEGVHLGLSVQNPDPSPSGKTGTGSPSAGSKPGQQQVDFSRRLPKVHKKESPDLVCTTTLNDFVMHHYGPDAHQPKTNLYTESIMYKIHNLDPDREIYVTRIME